MSTYMDTGDVNLLQDEAALANQAMRLAEFTAASRNAGANALPGSGCLVPIWAATLA